MIKSRERILKANITEHAKEAIYYDIIHREIFNMYEQKRIRKSLSGFINSFSPNAKILEVGAGTGNITKILVEFGYKNITCVDISKEMLSILKKKLKINKSQVICIDIDSFLEKQSSKYDIIVASSVVHHLPDYQDTLRKLSLALNRNGSLYITHEPFWKSRVERLESIIHLIDYGVYIFHYLYLIFTGKVKYLKRDCTISDYHTGENAIKVKNVTSIFRAQKFEYKINYYATAKYGFIAKVLQKFGFYNNFELLVTNNEKH